MRKVELCYKLCGNGEQEVAVSGTPAAYSLSSARRVLKETPCIICNDSQFCINGLGRLLKRYKDKDIEVVICDSRYSVREALNHISEFRRSNRVCEVDRWLGISPVYAYPDVSVPEYQTRDAVAFDIPCAEDVVIPPFAESQKPFIVHTGLKVKFGKNTAFLLLNRSSTPKLGLIMSNSVGVFEKDYYENDSNDGEILVSFINLLNKPVRLEKGQRVAQGMFVKIKRASNLNVKDTVRKGGFGSTGSSV